VLCLLSAKFYGNGNGEAEGAFKEESSVDVIDQSGIDITDGGEPAAAPVE